MKKHIVVLLIIITLIAMGYSLLAPLFPFMCQEKNIHEGVIGIIFSTYALSNILFIPFLNTFIKIYGRRTLCYFSITLCFLCTITFGLISNITNQIAFVVIAMINMFFEGIGIATLSIMIYSITSSLSDEDEIRQNMGYLELAYSFGLSLGPLFGSFLYYLSGYGLAFYTSGAMILLSFGFLSGVKINEEITDSKVEFFSMILHPEILVVVIAIICDMMSTSFIFPVFSTHLFQKFGLRVELTSVFFVFEIIGYVIAMQLLERISKALGNKLTMIIGMIVNMGCVLLLCPVSLFPQNELVVITGLSILGFGGVLITIPGIVELIQILRTRMKLDEQDSNDNASALYNFATCLGEAFGPLLGGYVTQQVGFQSTCYTISVINFGICSLFTLLCFKTIVKEWKLKGIQEEDLFNYSYDDRIKSKIHFSSKALAISFNKSICGDMDKRYSLLI